MDGGSGGQTAMTVVWVVLAVLAAGGLVSVLAGPAQAMVRRSLGKTGGSR